MPRRRYLSTTISADTAVNRLACEYGDFAALFYTWLIPHASDDGTLPADPEALLYLVLPGRRDKTVGDVAAALDAMLTLGLLIAVDGGRIGFPAPSFYRYQTYVKAENRRGDAPTNGVERETPENAEEQREPADNTASRVYASSSVPVSSSVSAPTSASGGGAASAEAGPPSGSEQPYDVYRAYCEEFGQPPESPPPPKQIGIAKHILSMGYTVADVRCCIRFLRSETWRTGLIDLVTVENQLPAWRTNGRPEHAAARASPAAARPRAGPRQFDPDTPMNRSAAERSRTSPEERAP